MAKKLSEQEPRDVYTLGQAMDRYAKARDVADRLRWEVVADPEPGADDWVRMVHAAESYEALEAELARLRERVEKQRAVVEAARPFRPQLHEPHNIYELRLRDALAALDQPAEDVNA